MQKDAEDLVPSHYIYFLGNQTEPKITTNFQMAHHQIR